MARLTYTERKMLVGKGEKPKPKKESTKPLYTKLCINCQNPFVTKFENLKKYCTSACSKKYNGAEERRKKKAAATKASADKEHKEKVGRPPIRW